MNDHTTARRQLEQLLAQDLTGMGFEARIRHQQRIEALTAECAQAAAENLFEADMAEPARPTAS